ncbi:MAG: MarR family transcriptional regulator [Oscillospiraceae bacterium]|nr:MarR family transcriptional regulator [Oscillospiraceae bacterium]
MVEESFKSVFDKFKFQFFRKIFESVRERDGSLSAMEAFSLEIIELLDAPTIGEFADFLNISQSNATYKVNSLMRKGYLERQNSETDRREYHLVLSEKFHNYMSLLTSYEDTVLGRIQARFTPEELEVFDRMMTTISDELMPECDVLAGSKKKD